jgi:hypothetical protein
MTDQAHDTLGGELADALREELDWLTPMQIRSALETVLPVVLRYADAQVAAERERIDADIRAAAARYVHGDRFAEVAARIVRGQS